MILNLTQHRATPAQTEAGVIDCKNRELLTELLTFNSLPTASEIRGRAEAIASLALLEMRANENPDIVPKKMMFRAMIGGAPFLMSALESALLDAYIQPVYAFSVRESEETILENGDTRKTNIFKHLGFIAI